MIILETGAGLPNSNSYATVEMADAYFSARSIAKWQEASKFEKEAALIRATDFIDANYVFRSVRAFDVQALECPRYDDGFPFIHDKVVRSTIELALIALDVDLFGLPVDRQVTSEEKHLGSLSTKTTYQINKTVDRFPSITKKLAGFANRRGASASSMRLTLK